MSDIPSISIGSITGGQNNIGKTEIAGDQIQTNNFGNTLTPDTVLDTLTKELPPDVKDSVEKEVFAPIRREFKSLAAMPIAEAEAKKPGVMDKIQGFISGLSRYETVLPTIQKAALGFTEAALSTIAPPVGALVAGALGLIRAVKPSSTPAFPPKRNEPPSSGFGDGGFSPPKLPSGMASGFGSGFGNSGMQ